MAEPAAIPGAEPAAAIPGAVMPEAGARPAAAAPPGAVTVRCARSELHDGASCRVGRLILRCSCRDTMTMVQPLFSCRYDIALEGLGGLDERQGSNVFKVKCFRGTLGVL